MSAASKDPADAVAEWREFEAWYWRSLPHPPAWDLIPRKRVFPLQCGWHGAVVGTACAECVREHAEYAETGTWADRRGPDWTVSAGGYRLVIEHGAIVGLACGEDPWPWGHSAWLVGHLVEDAGLRAFTGMPHYCGDACACPRGHGPMIYSRYWDEHACTDRACPYGVGVRKLIGAELPPPR